MAKPMGRDKTKPLPKVENPMKTLKRLLAIIFKKYKFHMLVVLFTLFAGVFANVQGTLFIQTLIDDYITPMIGQPDPDFTPLLLAIARVAAFYLLGAAATYAQARIMIYVTQGTMRDLRIQIFTHMESLPIKYFDQNSHGDIMSIYTNDIDTLRQMISQSIPQLLQSFLSVIGTLIYMIIK